MGGFVDLWARCAVR